MNLSSSILLPFWFLRFKYLCRKTGCKHVGITTNGPASKTVCYREMCKILSETRLRMKLEKLKEELIDTNLRLVVLGYFGKGSMEKGYDDVTSIIYVAWQNVTVKRNNLQAKIAVLEAKLPPVQSLSPEDIDHPPCPCPSS